EAGDLRRGGVGAGRLHPRPDHRPPDRAAEALRHGDAVHQPRPGGGARDQPPRARALHGPGDGAGDTRAALRASAASLHQGPLVGRADPRPAAGAQPRAAAADRRVAEPARSADRTALPALEAAGRPVGADLRAAAGGGRARAPRGGVRPAMSQPTMLTIEQTSALTRRITALSVGVAVVLTVIKAAAWWYSDSVSMLASLADSGLDVAASLATFFAVRYAVTPPD